MMVNEKRRSWLFLAVLISLAYGCGEEMMTSTTGLVENRFGPLAVLPFGGSDMARTEGVIRITDDCVFLNQQGEAMLLLWPDVRTSWDSTQSAVVFERIEGLIRGGEPIVTVVDGNAVVLGGGAGPSGSELGDAWIDTVEWVVAPKPECVTRDTWGVGDIAHLDGS